MAGNIQGGIVFLGVGNFGATNRFTLDEEERAVLRRAAELMERLAS